MKIWKSPNTSFLHSTALLSVVLILTLNVQSCKKSPFGCFTTTGEIEKVERQVPYFHSVQLNNNVNLELIPSNKTSLVIEAGSNLIPNITTEVNEDSILIIKNTNTCNWVRSYDKPINAYLKYRTIKSIEYRSIGTVTSSDTLRADSLQIDIYEGAGEINLTLRTYQCKANLHYGTADVSLQGISNISFYYQLGAGKIDARSLNSNFVYLRNWSSNEMFVAARTFLSAEIKGLGNVFYSGTPSIESSISGEGDLIKME